MMMQVVMWDIMGHHENLQCFQLNNEKVKFDQKGYI